MAYEKDDKQQIGLTPESNEAIATIAADYFGGSQQDAYRFAIAYAVGADLDLNTAPQGGYTTKFSALGTLETGSSIRDLLEILRIGEIGRPFATAEKLAELGVRDIARRLAGNETLADFLTPLGEE
ncbi:MAG: hypothetical protein IT193_12955 [Propionibacteriaceae bacterium]|nr:hypothetical protein [Propionibacteriaceae bacterium]